MTNAASPEADRLCLHDRLKVWRPNLSKFDVSIGGYGIVESSEMHVCPDEYPKEERRGRSERENAGYSNR